MAVKLRESAPPPEIVTVRSFRTGNCYRFTVNGTPLDNEVSKDELYRGMEYTLEDQSLLRLQLQDIKGSEELLISRNGIPLPASDHHPQKRLGQFRLFTLVPLAGFFVFLLAIGLSGLKSPNLLTETSLAMALLSLPCALFLYRGSRVALSLVIVMVLTDFLLTLFTTFSSGQIFLASLIGIKALLFGPLFHAFSLWHRWKYTLEAAQGQATAYS